MGLRSLLTHDNINVRLAALWIVGIGLHLAAWAGGYYFLPEDALRGVFPAASVVSGDGWFVDTLIPIVLYNIVGASLLIAAANLFRIGWFPLGYLPVLFHWTLFGVFRGTGSFEMAARSKAAPSLDALVSAGFVEITAYTFIAAATAGLYVYRQTTLLSLKAEKIRGWSELSFSRCSSVTVGVAAVMILAAAYLETVSIFSA